MSNDGEDAAKPTPARPLPETEIAGSFRLRPKRAQVSRLSRRALIGGTAATLILISGAVVWALRTSQTRPLGTDELYSTDHHNVADQLSSLPKDYSGIPQEPPRLGPPLPGDLGRPMVAAQVQSSPLAADAEQQRANQETEAARISKVFVASMARPSSGAATSSGNPTGGTASSDDAFAQNGQDRKLAFVNAPVDRRTTSPDRLAKPASPFVLQAGTVIPAALVTGVRSDLPGQIIAHVTENVSDSRTGRFRLVPQGARLIGMYDSQITAGQSRILLVWTRLIMPNGRSIVLERQPGGDAGGYAGLQDEVDNHYIDLFKAAALSTLLSVGTELGSIGNDSDIVQALRRGTGQSVSQTGQQIVRRNLNIQPTLTIRPGFPVNVIVNHDLVLEPYKEG